MNDKVLKSDVLADKIPLSSPKVLKREVYEATLDAREVVTQAQQKAQQILEEAERQRDAIFQQAEQEGQAAGLAKWNDILAEAGRRADQ